MTYTWSTARESIACRDGSDVVFEDSADHWENAVLRLLRLTDKEAREWVEQVAGHAVEALGQPLWALSVESKIEVLKSATAEMFGAPAEEGADPSVLERSVPIYDLQPDVVFTRLPERPDLAVVGSKDAGLGWLVDEGTGSIPDEPPVEYERGYFQGGSASVGYGDYLGQRAWREEKAERQIRELLGIASYLGLDFSSSPRALDVGAGFGYFRRALAEIGWSHEGVEPSQFANDVSAEMFGFSAYQGDLAAYAATESGTFDLIAMWDVIEHVRDPAELVRDARELLSERGALCIRTPSLDAVEREVWGARYHSYKSEHLFYFSPRSLVRLLEDAGFEIGFLTSQSHLFRGFLGHQTRGLANLLRGSDLYVVALRCQPRP